MQYCSIFCVVILLCSFSASAEDVLEDGSIDIAVVYVGTKTGEAFYNGAREALENHDDLKDKVRLIRRTYANDKVGAKLLEDQVMSKEGEELGDVELVFGPTNSGPILSFTSRESDLGQYETPIVTSLVTSGPEQDGESWFYSTAVSDLRKAKVLSQFITSKRIEVCAVLYDDTLFGRNAEFRLREELPASKLKHYVPYQIDSDIDVSQIEIIDSLLELKPEAIGIFASAEVIKEISDAFIARKKSIFSYRPLLFTSVDMKTELSEMDEIFFLTQLIPEKRNGISAEWIEGKSDVEVLSNGTMQIVLNTISEVLEQENGVFDPTQFRIAFSKRLNAVNPISGDLENFFRFRNYRNVAKPILVVGGREVELATVDFFRPEDYGGLTGIIRSATYYLLNYFELVWRRYGSLFYINLLIVAVLTSVISLNELTKSVKWRQTKVLAQKKYSVPYCLLQVFLICSLWVFLSEIESIAYDSFLAALLVGTAPNTFLNSAFFESSIGKALGLQALYSRLKNSLERKVDYEKSRIQKPKLNILFYYNSLATLKRARDRLGEIRPSGGKDLFLHEDRILDDGLKTSRGELDKRRLYSKWLLSRASWSELRDDCNLVKGLYEKMDEGELIDPESVIGLAEKNIENNEALEGKFSQCYDQISDTLMNAKNGGSVEHEELVDELNSHQEIFEKLCFVVAYKRLTPSQMVEKGYLEETWSVDLAPRSKNPRGLRRFLGRS